MLDIYIPSFLDLKSIAIQLLSVVAAQTETNSSEKQFRVRTEWKGAGAPPLLTLPPIMFFISPSTVLPNSSFFLRERWGQGDQELWSPVVCCVRGQGKCGR